MHAKSFKEALDNAEIVESLSLLYGSNPEEFLTSDIDKLTNLRSIQVVDFRKEEFHIPDSIVNLKKLELFHVTGAPNLKKIPDELSEISSLKSLLIDGARNVKTISFKVGGFENLNVLRLGFLLNEIPEELYKLVSLKGLSIGLGDYTENDKDFGNGLSELVSLDILNSSKKKLPRQFGKSINYISIEIDGQSELPFDFPKMDKLNNLSLKRFNHISKEIKYLNSLEKLDLFEFESEKIEFDGLSSLKYLGLEKSKIKDLSPSIQNAVNLRTIELGHSSIERFPIELSKLELLKGLNLQDCKKIDFDSLYSVIKNSQSINWVNLKNSNLSSYQVSKIKTELNK